MANLAERHDEEHSAQLADAEISRILSALQKAEFKRSETGNARPDQTFKPRSLMEIAETARQQDEAAKAAAITAEIAAHKAAHAADEAIDDTVDDMGAGSGHAPTDDKAPEPTGDDQSNEQQSAGVLDHASHDTGLEMPTAESDAPNPVDPSATDASMGADAGVKNEADNGVGNGFGPASPTSPFETAQAAYDRGYGDGVAAGREAAEAELRATIGAEFEAKFADKISAFETALIGLAKPQTVDTGALSRSLQAAVIKLAAAGTGATIDEMPELMVARIESLADAAGKNVAAGQVFMHPDDCAVIAPVMAARQEPVMIEADLALQRGDIRIRFDGMEIDDLLDRRVGLSQPAASPPPENIADQLDQTPPVADDETES